MGVPRGHGVPGGPRGSLGGRWAPWGAMSVPGGHGSPGGLGKLLGSGGVIEVPMVTLAIMRPSSLQLRYFTRTGIDPITLRILTISVRGIKGESNREA